MKRTVVVMEVIVTHWSAQMKMAAVQYTPPWGQPTIARQQLQGWVRLAAEEGANIIVCPEMAVSGYVFESETEIRPFCEPQDGPTFQMLAPIAQDFNCWIVCGFAEIAEDGRLYNSALVIGPNGTLVACYRKILLYELDETWATPGHQRMLIQTEYGTMAPAICMDLNDNNLIYWLWDVRPDILAFCTNWLNQDSPIDSYWKLRTPYWSGWFIGANRCGEERGTPFRGESAIISPEKRTVAQAQISEDGVLFWDTESAELEP